MNLTASLRGRSHKPHSEETKIKISLANKGRVFPPEFGIAVSRRRKGVKLSSEHKNNISIGLIGHKVSEKAMEQLKKKQFNKGCIPWNKGKTNVYSLDTLNQLSISKIGNKNPTKRKEVAEKISKKAICRFSDPIWRSKMTIQLDKSGRWRTESDKHLLQKEIIKQTLTEFGLDVLEEFPLFVSKKLYVIDVVGFGEELILVECGHCSKRKLDDLQCVFSNVLVVPLGLEKERIIEKLMELLRK